MKKELKDYLVNNLLQILKRDDIKDEIKEIIKPLIDMILGEIYPYILLSISLVGILFFMITIMFIIQMNSFYSTIIKNKNIVMRV